MFVFAYVAMWSGLSHDEWPVRLIYLTEAAFVIVAFVCVLLARSLRGTGTRLKRDIVAVVGGISASFGLIMPFELAPFFFGVRGEWMMATMGLIVVYPIAAALFIFLFRKFMNAARENTAR
jgi:thiosulfate dehydrogenase (quinone) large subunit